MAELDYKTMFENLKTVVDKHLEKEAEYCLILNQLAELSPYHKIVSDRLFELKMSEQLPILRHYLKVSQISKKLCEKHGWDSEMEDV